MALELSQYRPSSVYVYIFIATLASIWIVRIYRYRRGYLSLYGSLNAPPFSMWFGSIPAMVDMYKTSPMDTHPMATMTLLARKHNLKGMYFLDSWPFCDMRQLCVIDPEVAAQAVQKNDLHKDHLYEQMISHVAGKTSLLIIHGPQWKKTRSLFNPGFRITHLNTLVPSILSSVQIFHSTLTSLANSEEVTQIEEPITKLTVDIMGHVILNHSLNSQTSENELVNAFSAAVEWTPSATMVHPVLNLNPRRKFWHWWYARKMDNYLRRVLLENLAGRNDGKNYAKRGRPIIDLAIDEFMSSEGEKGEERLMEEFLQVAIDQTKTFLFAGYDTTSSTMCYIYYLLDLHPEELKRVREEHDAVFGDVSSTAENIRNDPKLLNDLPYTTAVIKETLRLYTPASTAREGSPSVNLTYDNTTIPTENNMVWILNHTMHRLPHLFPSPDLFLPTRFLPSSHPLSHLSPQPSIPKDAYRPFEKGPRGCIGQELATLELKIIMVMTIREFDVKGCYKEWDAKLGREEPGEMLGGRRGMFGYRAYQQMKVTGKPADGMPVRVCKREV